MDRKRRGKNRAVVPKSVDRKHAAALRGLPGVVLLLVIGAFAGACSDRPMPPNILLIVFDDLGFGALPSYGPSAFGDFELEAPVLDGLAARGLRVTQAYSNSPVCTPGRAALLTGRYPFSLGLRWHIEQNRPELISMRGIPQGVSTLPRLLEDAGYATGHFGKWHLGVQDHQLPHGLGFRRSAINRPAHNLRATATYFDRWLLVDGEEVVRSRGHFDAVITDYALAFMRENAARPFFANVWFNAPHEPLDPPQEFAQRYESSARGQYAALVSHADAQIGRLLTTLEKLQLRERTLVIVTSDNGAENLPFAHLNLPLRGDKADCLEGGIRVPLLFQWEGVTPPGSVSDAVVMGFDLLPTLAELVGIDVSGLRLDGRSQAHLLRTGRAAEQREPLFWDTRSSLANKMAVRDGPLKLVRHGSTQLYDVEDDPREQRDLVQLQRPRAAAMLGDYLTWRREVSAISTGTGSMRGAVSLRGSLPGSGWEFAGGSVEFEEQSLLDFHDGEFTLEMQVNVADQAAERFLAEYPGSWRMTIDSTGRLHVVVHEHGGDREAEVVSHASLESGETYEVAFAFRGGRRSPGALHLYVNGRDQGLVREVRAVRPGRGPLRLGADVDGEHPFHGVISGFRLFSAMLTEGDSVASSVAGRCDLNGDGECDEVDRAAFERGLGVCLGGVDPTSIQGRSGIPGRPGYRSRFDTDLDGCITDADRRHLFAGLASVPAD